MQWMKKDADLTGKLVIYCGPNSIQTTRVIVLGNNQQKAIRYTVLPGCILRAIDKVPERTWSVTTDIVYPYPVLPCNLYIQADFLKEL